MYDPSASGYLARSQRKKRHERARRMRARPRQRGPSREGASCGAPRGVGPNASLSATAAALNSIPAVRLSEVLRAQPSLFSGNAKHGGTGGRIHAANKHIRLIDRLPERYALARTVYLGGNDLTTADGLEQFVSITTLSLANNLISDPRVLLQIGVACPSIRVLSLEGNDVTHIPYYRARAIAAMPELKQLDGHEVTKLDLLQARDIDEKHSKSLQLLFQNDCLIHKLKRTASQIRLHSDLRAVGHGLNHGHTVRGRIPVTIIKSTECIFADKDGAVSSGNAFDIDLFLRRWRYMDLCSPEQRRECENRIASGARRFFDLLKKTNADKQPNGQNMHSSGQGGTGGESGKTIEKVSEPAHSALLWDEAYAQMMLVQQSSIAKLVDICRKAQETANANEVERQKKDPSGRLRGELAAQDLHAQQAQQDRERREQELRDKIEKLERTEPHVFCQTRLIVRQLLTAAKHGRTLFGKKIRQISAFFEAMDVDTNGLVSREEFHRTMRRLGLGLTTEQIDGMLNIFDEDHSGRLDKREFMAALRIEKHAEKTGNLPFPSPPRDPYALRSKKEDIIIADVLKAKRLDQAEDSPRKRATYFEGKTVQLTEKLKAANDRLMQYQTFITATVDDFMPGAAGEVATMFEKCCLQARQRRNLALKQYAMTNWLHSVELRLERIREMVDFADSRADDAEVKAGKALSKADAALWQVRLELKEQRELAQNEVTRKELQVQALRSEIEHISETLRNVRRDLSIEKAALISQKAETAQVVRSLTMQRDEYAEAEAAWRREGAAKMNALTVLKQQELTDVERIASSRESELLKSHAEEIATLQALAKEDISKAISEAEKRHKSSSEEMAQRYDAKLVVEKEKLEKALAEARKLAAKQMSHHTDAKRENDKLLASVEELRKEKLAEVTALKGQIANYEIRMGELEATMASRVKEFEADRAEASRHSEEQRTKLERYREVSLALEAAGKSLKADLARAEGSVTAWKTQAAKEEARAKAAETLLLQKNKEIRRLRQGLRMKGAATEEALGRAAAAENREASLRPQLAEARAVAKEAVAHLKDIDKGYVSRPNESFSERLERSLISASRDIEALADEEHSLWRRDAAFGAWVEDSVGESGKENQMNASGRGKNAQLTKKSDSRVAAAAELEKLERQLKVLKAKAGGGGGGGSDESAWI
eukprot:g5268.t1